MSLHLQRVDTYFSVYTDASDPMSPVYRVNVTFRARWSFGAAMRLRSALELYDLDDLTDVLATVVTGYLPDLYTCDDCTEVCEDVSYCVGNTVCDSCRESYSYCAACEEYVCDTSYVDDIGEDLCDDCQSNLPWCEECDERVGDYHDCPNAATTCECHPHSESFTFAGLANDTRRAVCLPDGVLSDEGRWAIRSYLFGAGQEVAARLVEDLEPVWQTKRGNYTKRLGSAAHKAGVTLDPATLSEVGNLFRAHSGGSDVTVDITRRYDRGADYFYHSDSCWFSGGEYGASLCWLKTTAGFGLRTVGANEWNARGRAWVLPVNDALESCPMDDATAFVVFNGYGDLEGYAAARIVATMTGLSYTKVYVDVSGAYINGDSGYLVGSPALVATRPAVSIREYASC